MFEFNPDCNAPLSPEEKEYLKHVDEGKIEPLTMKEKIKFFNNVFAGSKYGEHTFQLEDNGPIMTVKISTRKNRNTGRPAGRPKGQGRGKRCSDNDIPEMSVNQMPESWAALFLIK